LASSVLIASAEAAAQRGGHFRHAYYLFVSPPADACEACYVPLLLTATPLDEIARISGDQACVVITTYQRDSIVRLERGVVVSPENIGIQERQVRLRDRLYRYQEITAAEVLRLLEHPEGTIPIHRTIGMGVPARAELEDLITSFRDRK
jgi:hypothetical protein